MPSECLYVGSTIRKKENGLFFDSYRYAMQPFLINYDSINQLIDLEAEADCTVDTCLGASSGPSPHCRGGADGMEALPSLEAQSEDGGDSPPPPVIICLGTPEGLNLALFGRGDER